MQRGKALEVFIKQLLINVGFSKVPSDGLYIFDGTPGQMIQGLGSAHNADVLLEPPVQTPFYYPTRLLIECKDYSNESAGIEIVRNVFGIREDINHFEVIDKAVLNHRRNTYQDALPPTEYRYSYQVALAATSGYTKFAQLFAAAHRIPLLDLNSIPYWDNLLREIHNANASKQDIIALADDIGKKMAVAVLDSGQLLFLYQVIGASVFFDDDYSLYWSSPHEPWQLISGSCTYTFHLPEIIMQTWLSNSSREQQEAINLKEQTLSNMVVYYRNASNLPTIKMISINRAALNDAKRQMGLSD